VEANRNKPRSDNIHSLTGTTAHNLLEMCQRLEVDPQEYVGKVDAETKLEITEEMAEAVLYALEYIQDYLANDPGAVIKIEEPVYPSAYLGIKRDMLWGTPDIQIHGTKELVTIDYKHGVGVRVDVEDNHQIKLYHLGGAHATKGRYRRYRSVVIQPRVPRRHPVQETTLTAAALQTYAEKTIRPAIPIALADGAPRKAGDHCRFCHASGNCEAQMGQKLKKAAREFTKEPDDLTEDKIAQYLQLAAEVEIAIKDLRAEALRRLDAGKKIAGWVKGWTNARRVWADEEAAIKLAKKKGLTPREIYSVELLSPAKLEDLLVERGLQEKKRKGKPAPPNPFADYYGYTERSPTLAKE
jgi:hypothetical protein